MNNPEILLHDILKLQADMGKQNMKLPPGLAGIYGEILAWKELEPIFKKKGFEVHFGSGSSKADIILTKGNKKIKIEVKTSRLKEEQPGLVYGFAINVKKCKEHPSRLVMHPKKGKVNGDFCYFDFLLIVTLSDDLKKHAYYIIPREYLWNNEQYLRNKSKRFSSGTHRVIFVERMKNKEEITSFDKQLTKNRNIYQNAWHLIQ